MPQPNLVRAFVALWWTLGVVLLVLSIRTALHALAPGWPGADVHAAVLGSVEAVAAVLFLVPRTTRAGGLGLLATFAVALLLHAAQGEFAGHLLIYAAGVLFVVVHGPMPLHRHGNDVPVNGRGGPATQAEGQVGPGRDATVNRCPDAPAWPGAEHGASASRGRWQVIFTDELMIDRLFAALSWAAIGLGVLHVAATPVALAQPQSGAVRREDPAWVTEDRAKRIVYSVPGMSDVDVRRNVTYRRVDSVSLAMDVYLPPRLEPNERRPVVVLMHGGPLPPNLLTLPKDWGEFQSIGELIGASGFVGVTFNHRFHGSMGSLPTAEGDLLALIEYLRGHADEFHIDRDRVTLWAFSGSGLLLTHALRVAPPYVRALVSYYAALDLSGLDRARPGTVPPEILSTYSPLRALAERRGPFPPLLVARAGLDRPGVNGPMDRFLQVAMANNASIDLFNHMTGHHGFDIADDTDRSREILRRTIEFIRDRMNSREHR